MIAINENGVVYLACSQKKMFFEYNSCIISEKDILDKENLFVWRVKNIENCIMLADDTNIELIQKIKYSPTLFEGVDKIDRSSIFKYIYPRINKIAREYFEDEKKIKFKFAIAQNDRLFLIEESSINEPKRYTCGDDYYDGAMDKYENLPIYERIQKICYNTEYIAGVSIFPIVVMNTGDEKTTVIKREEIYEIDN